MYVFYRGNDIAHFHDHEEIDIRLSPRFILQEGLTPFEAPPFHLKRSKKSRWMQIRFTTNQELDGLRELIKRSIKDDYENTAWGKQSLRTAMIHRLLIPEDYADGEGPASLWREW